MTETAGYYVVKKRALPEILLKVVEAKRLIDSEKVESVQEAVDLLGISRSSFYKYKDDIFPFHDTAEGTTITLTFQMDDEPGRLSHLLGIVGEFGANILTIHQSIPINGVECSDLKDDGRRIAYGQYHGAAARRASRQDPCAGDMIYMI